MMAPQHLNINIVQRVYGYTSLYVFCCFVKQTIITRLVFLKLETTCLQSKWVFPSLIFQWFMF